MTIEYLPDFHTQVFQMEEFLRCCQYFMLFATDFPILSLDVSCSHVHLQISAVSEVEQSYPLKLVDICGRRNAVLDKLMVSAYIQYQILLSFNSRSSFSFGLSTFSF